MAVFRWMQELPQYLWEGAMRIFGPDDNAYPPTGFQPFDGDPFDKKQHHD